MAKASILWLVGEYCALVPKIAPDVLRKAAKNFLEEVHVYLYLWFLICTHKVVVQINSCINYITTVSLVLF